MIVAVHCLKTIPVLFNSGFCDIIWTKKNLFLATVLSNVKNQCQYRNVHFSGSPNTLSDAWIMGNRMFVTHSASSTKL